MPADPASAARAALEMLASAAPDAGDDTTQLVLDDALDAIEDRLRALASTGGGTVARPTSDGEGCP
ncbi:hypothetical protein MOPEL_073_01250 [Mobilicoccus pelagius NBRC 104925]|uniref:Uncharacterized protein n=1 Tax=Mobilicoccus pelagius NBRC 104925 TaxID=1089455 RepID=H5URX6_9MICO|nr:hypothetical protein MOPEL_073_01250 [Mobilicoccus pelagius NBRC 104925]